MKKTSVLILIIMLLTSLLIACEKEDAAVPDSMSDQILILIEGADKTQITFAEFLAIEQSSYEISRTNSKGKTTTAVYSGVKWDKLAKAIGAPKDVSAVTVVASDGFSQAYGLDALNAEKSIFAMYMDEGPITQDSDKGQIWFCADENFTANYWTKYIEKIVIS